MESGSARVVPEADSSATPGRLLTVAEVAAQLRVCRATIYRLCSEGKLSHVRVSNTVRIPSASLVAFMTARIP